MVPSSAIQLGCLHVYHEACISAWAKRADTCPTCRQPFTPADVAAMEKREMETLAHKLYALPTAQRQRVVHALGTMVEQFRVQSSALVNNDADDDGVDEYIDEYLEEYLLDDDEEEDESYRLQHAYGYHGEGSIRDVGTGRASVALQG
jgi:RING-H2 zinc finger domain